METYIFLSDEGALQWVEERQLACWLISQFTVASMSLPHFLLRKKREFNKLLSVGCQKYQWRLHI